MIIEHEMTSELRDRHAEERSRLLLFAVGATALFWGIVLILLV